MNLYLNLSPPTLFEEREKERQNKALTFDEEREREREGFLILIRV